ncbi:hypothetical protein ABTX61_09325 [Amycolatopsis japonica]|uniref:hypothetical protein n=1 Tax=Amycolatopsis japonica TaxID=208439 RepID=UPI00332EB615
MRTPIRPLIRRLLGRCGVLVREEVGSLIDGLRAAILAYLRDPASPDRARYLVSPILFLAGGQADT